MSADNILYNHPFPAEIYDAEYQKLEDLPFWSDLAAVAGDPTLELACGTGRLVLPLARTGHDITGIDLSPHMLGIARRKLAQEQPEVQARVRLLDGDMRDFSLDKQFRLIFIAFRSFQILPSPESQRQCLENCCRHLAPGGLLAFNVFSPRLDLMSKPEGADFDHGSFTLADRTVVKETAHAVYDNVQQLLLANLRYECTTPDGGVICHEFSLQMRYLYRFELEWMLEACGFEVEAIYGNYDRSPYQAGSPEIIAVARRKA
jgi:ubiquinone/menaquinone biosynthesis C-methylase UbiE